MTNMIQIDRGQLVDAFAQFLAAAEPAIAGKDQIDVRTMPHLAGKARELVAAGAFRNKTIYGETQERLLREGYSEAQMMAISEMGLQMGRAVNSAFMNAAGVYSSTAKLFKAFETNEEAAYEEDIPDELMAPPLSDEDIGVILEEEYGIAA